VRVEALTFFRFIAAIIVVIFHFGGDTQLAAFSKGFLTSGPQFVSFFFVLSGFVLVLAHPPGRPLSTRKFLLARVARIAPLYYFALLVIMLFTVEFSEQNIKAFVLSSLFLQSWIPPYPLALNGPGWSLSTEVFLYLCFPLILSIVRQSKLSTKTALITAVVFWLTTQAVIAHFLREPFYQGNPSVSFDLIHFFPLVHLASFVIGMATALWVVEKTSEKSAILKILPSTTVLVIASLLLYFSLEYKWDYSSLQGFNPPLHAGFYAPIFAFFIAAVSFSKDHAASIFSLKPLVFLGEISYGIYILQSPLYRLYRQNIYSLIEASPDQKFYFFLLLLIICSALLFLFLEKPLQKYLKRKWNI
jgi:peptidoglycan/LPS O-acetylase OafA/YrhL